LKPENILLDLSWTPKIADFGTAKKSRESPESILGGPLYIGTRYYRAPYTLFGQARYDFGSDLYSFGMIAAELLLDAPLLPGRSSKEQQHMTLTFLGPPPDRFMHECIQWCSTPSPSDEMSANEAQKALEIHTHYLAADSKSFRESCKKTKQPPSFLERLHNVRDANYRHLDQRTVQEGPNRMLEALEGIINWPDQQISIEQTLELLEQ
jgi:serine/threonine protein kinase